ncbi:MsnO8 family LLM class oxidoreductase [Luteimicrobium subarcticum]|uniref:Luciferase family oxidoreductase group 1 n=1 Tax=Luteimicrobium subarcticum TaxID=620910 RepID=A0A2M8WSF8_9MICO|nr:MsnO8 family LLM class oxidoreductase [Luteimicrobium subarcticum]PJI93858.1 luciferase family oxidoreductase group 1 [Luteimicrobium subarcticum]
MTALSVLDLVPVRSDQTTSDALAASLALARTADDLGFARYWLAEHHNMRAVAATNPPVLVALFASATRRIVVGSGGVMLPNHPALVVAEQFGLLEAAFPGRIDLGIGRAPGSDPVTSYLLRGGRAADGVDPAEQFPEEVATVVGLLQPGGVSLALGARSYDLAATPAATSAPTVWLLGSSMYSAQLAAARGLPYVFASHFGGGGAHEALAAYRSGFRPSEALAAPRTIGVVNAVVAADADEAHRLALPQQRSMYRLRSGGPLVPGELVEDAEASPLDPRAAATATAMSATWVVGDAASAAEQVRAFADDLRVDEVMVSPVAGAFTGTPADASPAREETLRLLAQELLP